MSGEEVAVPHLASASGERALALLHDGFRLGVELLGAVQERAGRVRVVDEEVRVRGGRHGDGEVVVVEQARGVVAVHVRELAVGVARHEEEAARRPLERLLRTGVVRPDGGDAASAEDVDLLVDREFQRRERVSGRYLLDAALDHALHAAQLHERRVDLAVLPPTELSGAEVFHVVAPVDGDVLRFHPVVVGETSRHAVPPPVTEWLHLTACAASGVGAGACPRRNDQAVSPRMSCRNHSVGSSWPRPFAFASS